MAQINHFVEFSLGATAAMCAACITNPVEVVKTRMQLQGELKHTGQYTRYYRNTFHALYTIAKYDGIRGVQSGLVPALGYQMTTNGTRLGIYQVLSDMGFTDGGECKACGFFRNLAAGAFAGAIGNATGSPFFLIKTHIQCKSDTEIAVGYQHKHRTLFQAVKEIVGEHGIRGLLRGITGGSLRGCVGSAAQLGAFAPTKQLLLAKEVFEENSIMIPVVASMVSGVSLAFFVTPFDVMCIRLYNQETSKTGKGMCYSGILDCFAKTYRTEGIAGLYKGWEPTFLRMWPHSVLILVFWDSFRSLYYK